MIFQDDLARVSTSAEAAQKGNDRIEKITNLKQLEINIEKSSYIILGNKKKVSEIRQFIQNKPLTLNNKVINEKDSEKYLGDYLHNKGSQESINFTIKGRQWRVTSVILEIKTIIEDCRTHHIGGLLTGVQLWELAILPMLLNNAGTWDEISKVSEEKLDDFQNTLLRYLLNTPRTTPIPSLAWEFGMLPMKYRVIIRKLCLLKHMLSLDNESLAKQIIAKQSEESLPGLAKESKAWIQELGLPDIFNETINKECSKTSWKKQVKNAVLKKCEKELKSKIIKHDKHEKSKMTNECFETKDYIKNMNMGDARIKFKLRTNMTNVKFNYKSNPSNSKSLWQCDSCQSAIESQDHVLWCPAYQELREGKDINNDSNLIDHIRKVVQTSKLYVSSCYLIFVRP